MIVSSLVLVSVLDRSETILTGQEKMTIKDG